VENAGRLPASLIGVTVNLFPRDGALGGWIEYVWKSKNDDDYVVIEPDRRREWDHPVDLEDHGVPVHGSVFAWTGSRQGFRDELHFWPLGEAIES
jgi:hypothetical protein